MCFTKLQTTHKDRGGSIKPAVTWVTRTSEAKPGAKQAGSSAWTGEPCSRIYTPAAGPRIGKPGLTSNYSACE